MNRTDPPWLPSATIIVFLLGFFFSFLGHIDYYEQDGVHVSFFEKLVELPPNGIGDTLAGVFGTLAFFAATIAILLQSRELRLQREELSTNNENLERQRFDNFVFEIVNTHNSIVQSIEVRRKHDSEITNEGRDAIAYFYREFCEEPDVDKLLTGPLTEETLQRFEDLYQRHGADLGHYFRYIYNAMRVIGSFDYFDESHRRIYKSLFSDDEILLIFYNCLSDRGRPMAKYAVRFGLFDNLPRERLVRQEHAAILDELIASES